MVERATGAPHGQEYAIGSRFSTASKIKQIHAHGDQHAQVIGAAKPGGPQQGPREAMLQRKDGLRQFAGLTRQLHGIGQDHDLRSEGSIGQALIVMKSLPGDRQKSRRPLGFTRIGILEGWRQNVPDVHRVVRTVCLKLRGTK